MRSCVFVNYKSLPQIQSGLVVIAELTGRWNPRERGASFRIPACVGKRVNTTEGPARHPPTFRVVDPAQPGPRPGTSLRPELPSDGFWREWQMLEM